VLSLFAQAMHVAQVRHAVCEHGYVVHGPADAGTPETARAERPSPSAPAVAPAPVLESEGEHHHHCPLAVPAPCVGFAVARGADAASLASSRTLEERPTEVRVRAFALYLLAPHHSPPTGGIVS
jgi:hypothetical protein